MIKTDSFTAVNMADLSMQSKQRWTKTLAWVAVVFTVSDWHEHQHEGQWTQQIRRVLESVLCSQYRGGKNELSFSFWKIWWRVCLITNTDMYQHPPVEMSARVTLPVVHQMTNISNTLCLSLNVPSLLDKVVRSIEVLMCDPNFLLTVKHDNSVSSRPHLLLLTRTHR